MQFTSEKGVRSVPRLPMTTTLGPVVLAVTDRTRALAIWRDVVGLSLIAEDEQALRMGVGQRELVTLQLGAQRPVRERSLGLYHLAIHVPTRADLAQMAVRALQRRVRISPTDHLVSEAIYLWDLDGNGIEVTFETPWRGRLAADGEGGYVHSADGSPHSGREPIDFDGLLAELGPNAVLEASMPEGTRIGHIHLHVDDLDRAMVFYRDVIGFGGLFIIRDFGMGDVGLNYMPHAIAFNIWAGPSATQPPAGTAGLRSFDIVLPDAETLAAVIGRIDAAQVPREEIARGVLVKDPAGNRVRIVVA